VSVLLPAPCRICGATLTDANRPICASCFASIEPIDDPMCSCCGRPFELVPQVEKAPGLCRRCRTNFCAFESARSFAHHNDALAGGIVLLKYEEGTRLGNWFAKRLGEVIRSAGEEFQADGGSCPFAS